MIISTLSMVILSAVTIILFIGAVVLSNVLVFMDKDNFIFGKVVIIVADIFIALFIIGIVLQNLGM